MTSSKTIPPKPEFPKEAYENLLSAVDNAARRANEKILIFIQERSIQAMKQNNMGLLPNLDDVVHGIDVPRGTIQQQLPYMYRDKIIERLGTPGKFRYAAKFHDIAGKLNHSESPDS
jgi:hypothetical protein